MIIKEMKFKSVYEIELGPIYDNRGYFKRTYDEIIFEKYGMNKKWVQENQSFTKKVGTVRGLHFQFPPHTETKLIRVVDGTIYDVFVDLRISSKTFGQWDSVILSSDNNKMVFIPKGLAHGFCTLTDNCNVLYKVDNFYNPYAEGGIIWNDKDLNIDWKIDNPIISQKDSNLMTMKNFIEKYKYLSEM